MKKYLFTAALAVAVSGAFVSCHEDEISGSLIEQKAKAFEEIFVETFGTPAPYHTWGFKTNNIIDDNGVTRTSHPNDNQWGDPQYYGLEVPSTPSAIEREYVMEWFSHVREGHGETLDVNDYFVQQIGYGEDYAGEWGDCKYKPNAQFLEKFDGDEPYYRQETPEVKSKNQMDWIAANLTAQTANRSDIGLILDAEPNQGNGRGFEDFDHIYNFNAGSGEIMLMKDSETKYGFSFHDSYGTDDKLVTQNYYMVHLVADYKGEHIDGWYVGFDYQTLKKQTYDDGTHHVEYTYVDLQPDGRYNDRVVKIVPAAGGPTPPDDSTDEWKIVEGEKVIEAGRVFCEDLGANTRNDVDYNDVVFDAIIVNHYIKLVTTTVVNGVATTTETTNFTKNGITGVDETYAKVCLLAAGGTIPANVCGHEIHNELSNGNLSTAVMINTTTDRESVNGAQIDYSCSPVIIQEAVSGQEGVTQDKKFYYNSKGDLITCINDIDIVVLYGNAVTTLTANPGSKVPAVPYKFCVPIGTPWAKERVNIGLAYEDFDDYCQTGPSVEFWKGRGVNASNLWDNCFSLFTIRDGSVIRYIVEGDMLCDEIILDQSTGGSGGNGGAKPGQIWPNSGSGNESNVSMDTYTASTKFANATSGQKLCIYSSSTSGWIQFAFGWWPQMSSVEGFTAPSGWYIDGQVIRPNDGTFNNGRFEIPLSQVSIDKIKEQGFAIQGTYVITNITIE